MRPRADSVVGKHLANMPGEVKATAVPAMRGNAVAECNFVQWLRRYLAGKNLRRGFKPLHSDPGPARVGTGACGGLKDAKTAKVPGKLQGLETLLLAMLVRHEHQSRAALNYG